MGDYDLNVSKEDKGNYILIRVAGAINPYTYDAFKEKVMEAINENNLVIDMSQVEVLTSTGVGILFELKEKADSLGKKLFLLSPSNVVEHVIGLTGFLDLFNIVKDESEIKL